MDKNVCVIIVTYNRLTLLKKCIDRIDNQVFKPNHVLIFNNNSTDGTKEWLLKLKKQENNYLIHNSTNNLGGAGGFSEAVRIAYEKTNDDFFWLMDDDTMPTENSLKHLMTAGDELNYKFGFLCSTVLWKDDSVVNLPIIDKINWANEINSELIQVRRSTFVSILFTRKMVLAAGIPAADMVIWGDDTEYTTRLSSLDPSYLVIKSRVYHATAVNTQGISVVNDDLSKMTRYMYMFRNNISVARMYSKRRVVLKILLKDLKELKNILFLSQNNKRIRFITVVKGMVSGMMFKPKIKTVNKL